MKRSTVIVIITVAVILAAVGSLLAAKHASSPAASSDMSHMNMPDKTKPATSSTNDSNNLNATATNSVTIENFTFAPASITVKKGTSVTWTNKDSTRHTVTETDGQQGPDSGNLDNGKSYSFTFNTAGTFKYHCALHPDMTGTVIVTE